MEFRSSQLEGRERKPRREEALVPWVTFAGSSWPPGPTPHCTDGELVWILGGQWQALIQVAQTKEGFIRGVGGMIK